METTYTSLRQNLADVLDRVADNQEIIIVRRRKAKDVAMISASELTGLLETAHLLRSPRNAQRLLTAVRRAMRGTLKRRSVTQLRREIGLGPGR
jgi:antitoxin YefM